MRRIRQHLTYANVMATIAVFGVVAGGGAYAASKIGPNEIARNAVRSKHIKQQAVKTGEIDGGAVNSSKVKNFALRLHDLGGRTNRGTTSISSTVNVPPGQCNERFVVESFNPQPKRYIGSLVVGYVTDAAGDAVLPNRGVVVPTVISETSQGGAQANLMVCDLGNAGQTVPAGSVFHYSLIGP
jgi:hypothetical protein